MGFLGVFFFRLYVICGVFYLFVVILFFMLVLGFLVWVFCCCCWVFCLVFVVSSMIVCHDLYSVIHVWVMCVCV